MTNKIIQGLVDRENEMNCAEQKEYKANEDK
jgi:hypothetical protein